MGPDDTIFVWLPSATLLFYRGRCLQVLLVSELPESRNCLIFIVFPGSVAEVALARMRLSVCSEWTE